MARTAQIVSTVVFRYLPERAITNAELFRSTFHGARLSGH